MAQKLLKDMADTGYENMSEETGYILHELKVFAQSVSAKVETLTSQDQLFETQDYFDKRFKEFIECMGLVSEKIDGMKDAIQALADKLDSEDVTNLDTDYRSVVDSNL